MFNQGVFVPQQKLLFHTQKILQWLNGINVYPILTEFDLSNACNQKCLHCNFSYLTDKSLLDKNIACKTIRILADNQVKALNHTGGGEPLMHKDFGNIASWTCRQGIEQGLFTNGTLITDDLIQVLLATQTWIRISIDAGTKESYKRIRGTDDFDKVISIVKKLVSARDEGRYSTQIGIGFVITPDNYTEIERFGDLIRETKVDYGQYKPGINIPDTSREWWIGAVNPKLEQVFSWNKKASINLYKFNDQTSSQFDKPYPVCYGHIFCPCIGADGKVWICNQLRGIEEFCIGNLYEQSFDKIWEGKLRQEVIKRIDVAKCPPSCKNNEINKILYHIRHPDRRTHYNFL